MIVVIDYGMGNLLSITRALAVSGAEAVLTNKSADLRNAAGIVLPGVGAFSHGMENLGVLGLIPAIRQASAEGKPILGICLGMQLMFQKSEESSGARGLGLLRGRVRKFPGGVKVPHMGWNTVSFARDNALFRNIPESSYFYFAHSYYVDPEDETLVTGATVYGNKFPSALNAGNIYATQFHPEKSHKPGLALLAAFRAIAYNTGITGGIANACKKNNPLSRR